MQIDAIPTKRDDAAGLQGERRRVQGGWDNRPTAVTSPSPGCGASHGESRAAVASTPGLEVQVWRQDGNSVPGRGAELGTSDSSLILVLLYRGAQDCSSQPFPEELNSVKDKPFGSGS